MFRQLRKVTRVSRGPRDARGLAHLCLAGKLTFAASFLVPRWRTRREKGSFLDSKVTAIEILIGWLRIFLQVKETSKDVHVFSYTLFLFTV